jgi:hypothetical protein
MVEDYEWPIHMTMLTYSHVTEIRQGFKIITKLRKEQKHIRRVVIIRLSDL